MPRSTIGESPNPPIHQSIQPTLIPGMLSSPGILVFNSALQLNFMNQQAIRLAARINEAQDGLLANGVIPSEVIQLCNEILTAMLTRTDAKAWEEFHLQKIVGPTQHPVVLRGFGLPDPAGIKQSHILIFLDEVFPNQDLSLDQVQARFHLTPRELTVLQVLCKGLTNKEIAADLGIAEQTVKEHLKNIMAKTGATTRTGILALALGLHSEEQGRAGKQSRDRLPPKIPTAA